MDPAPLSGAPGSPSFRADWYPDPTRRFEFRYYNGQAWTGDVSADGKRFLDPLVTAFVPFHEPNRSAGSGKATAALVLGIGSVVLGWVPFVCVAAIAGAILALVFGSGVLKRDRAIRREGAVAPRGHGMALTGMILAPIGLVASGIGIWLTVVSIREVNEYTNVGAHTTEIQVCEVHDGVARAEGTITNLTSKTRSYHVTVEFVRPGTDDRLDLESTDVDDVPPGESGDWSMFLGVSEEEVECRIQNVTGPLPFSQS